jgi:N6-adenosine-specific RNA methylase IME4
MEKKYNIIYADPPWDVKAGPGWNSNGLSRELLYPTMTISEIKSLRVIELAARNSHLYLWTINKYIYESYEIARTWGFRPSVLLTWCKSPHGIGLGGAFIQTSEHLLFCYRGNLRTQTRIDTTWFQYKRREHSVKPSEFRDMIITISGDLPRIELFARKKTHGWDVWGNEVKNDYEFEEKTDLYNLLNSLERC